MNCPFCSYHDSRVIDSRDINEGIRRRRQCVKCGRRYTTYERWQAGSLFVIKKDERREDFNREKLLAGIRKACEKRPLPAGAIEKLADDVEAELYRLGKPEISSAVIGDMVLERLKKLDYIAYIRFASVYRDFSDLGALKRLVDSLAEGEPPNPATVPTNQLSLLPADEQSQTPASLRSRRKMAGMKQVG